MSGGLCPSKSTVYVGNLPFSLTNNDLHKLLEKYGKVVKVTTVKDKETHKSTGVAFVLFLKKDDAQNCVRSLNGTQLFGRTLKCTIAKDNGRASEFIRRKVYHDKSRCYECGDIGHLSYHCPQNMLGDREPEKKEKKKKTKFQKESKEEYGGSEAEAEAEAEEEEEDDPALESLSAAIRFQQEKVEEEEYRAKVISGQYGASGTVNSRKKFRQSDYFSDEEEVEEA